MTASQSANLPLSPEQQSQSITVEIRRLYVKEQSCKVSQGSLRQVRKLTLTVNF